MDMNRKRIKSKEEKAVVKVNKPGLLFVIGIYLFVLLLSADVYAQSTWRYASYQSNQFSQPTSQFYQPNFQNYYGRLGVDYTSFWPSLVDPEKCEAGQDFIVSIRPGSCMPAVVRSDLLEEQNVPIFCKLDAVKLNPLIEVSEIKSVRFKGQYPKEIAGISFHPSLAALRMYNARLDSPLINDVGYIVVVLKRSAERDMPDFIEANLTAVLRYDIENAFGTGKPQLILPQMTDEEWSGEFRNYGFWKGKGYARLNWIEGEQAEIAIFSDENNIIRRVRLSRGETSNLILMPGFYCRTGVRIKLNSMDAPERKIKLQVDGEELWLRQGESFLEEKCKVSSIESIEEGGEVKIRCTGKSIMLRLGVSDIIGLEKNRNKISAELGKEVESGKHVVYSGIAGKKLGAEERNFIILAEGIDKKYLEDDELKKEYLERVRSRLKGTSISKIEKKDEFESYVKEKTARVFGLEKNKVSVLWMNEQGEDYKFIEAGKTSDKTYSEEIEESFEKTEETAEDIISLYGGEEDNFGESYGEKALRETAELAGEINKKETQEKLLREIIEKYPDSDYAKQAEFELQGTANYDYENAGDFFDVELGSHYFRLLKIKEPEEEEASVVFLIDGEEKRVIKGEDIISKEIKENEEDYEIIKDDLDKVEKDAEARYKVELKEGNYSLSKEEKLEWWNGNEWKDVDSEIKNDNWKKKLKNDLIKYKEAKEIVSKENEEKLVLEDFDENEATIEHTYKDEDGRWRNEKEKFSLGERASIGIFDLRVKEINLKREASINILPEIPSEYTEANFSFKVGIEKRAIQLTPEKTSELIRKLNKTIENWEKIVNKLGEVIKGWKAACFATSALLTIKSFVENLGGKSMARQEVMRGRGGWHEECTKLVADGKYTTLDACFFGERNKINSAVNELEKQYIKTNQEVQQASQKHTKSDGIFGSYVDTKAAGQDYMSQVFLPYYQQNKAQKVKLADGTEMSLQEAFGSEEQIKEMYEKGKLSWGEMRDITTYGRFAEGKDDISQRMANNKLNLVLPSIHDARIQLNEEKKSSPTFGDMSVLNLVPLKQMQTPADIRKLTASQKDSLTSNPEIKQELSKEGAEFVRLNIPQYTKTSKGDWERMDKKEEYKNIAGKELLVKVNQKTKGAYEVGQVYSIENGKITGEVKKEELINYMGAEAGVGYFEKQTPELCSNPYRNPKIKFFETSPYKGLPAVVPVDVKNGWYAATKPIISPVFGMKPYTESGQVNSFWLCNVGKNGLEEFDSSVGDDSPCIQINMVTNQPTDQISCLTAKEARNLVYKATSLIREAARGYGKKTISLSGIGNVEVGMPAGMGEGTSCQDFMSPEDCYLMFNVCDPVICPASRCNLGGAYPVDDVIQTGVVGSLVLCLPNIREGIFVPVCLTGVHAGLDSYLSILKSFRDCLQESLDTGSHVGVCDEVFSIYLCEFFWRQMAPVLDVAIPKLIEGMYGQGTRGGGEYLTVQNSWDNMEKSASYFKDYYALNAFNAFKARSTAEAGGTICKAFIGTRYPTNKNLLDALLEPESPVQFYAWFDEIPYSEATVPATSQYKVYYHVYAGKDQGHYFSVYLKSPPESGYYSSQPYVFVDTGYIGISQSVDKAKDFTAPAGYKELCVRIDTKEECGFKQVSTDFALNYIKDKYVEEQVAKQVNSEKECVSGSPSLIPVAQPNIQEGISEAAMPAIYNRGVIRVCSSDNPGARTNPSRWENVGFCDQGKGINCWLDTDSVKESIRNLEIENRTLQTAKDISNELEGVGILTLEETYAELSEKEKEANIILGKIKKGEVEQDEVEEIVRKLEELEREAFGNENKVKVLYLKFGIYKEFTKSLFMKVKKVKEEVVVGAEEFSDSELEQGVTETLEEKEEIKIKVNNKEHFVSLDEVDDDSVIISVTTQKQTRTISEGEFENFKFADEGDEYLKIKVVSIQNKKAVLEFKKLKETGKEIVEEEKKTEETIKEKGCGGCGGGFWNLCDREECKDLGNCFFVDRGLLNEKCFDCSSIKKCEDYEDDETSCEEDVCGFENCKFKNNLCEKKEKEKTQPESTPTKTDTEDTSKSIGSTLPITETPSTEETEQINTDIITTTEQPEEQPVTETQPAEEKKEEIKETPPKKCAVLSNLQAEKEDKPNNMIQFKAEISGELECIGEKVSFNLRKNRVLWKDLQIQTIETSFKEENGNIKASVIFEKISKQSGTYPVTFTCEKCEEHSREIEKRASV